MKILSLSDEVDPLIYSPRVKILFGGVDLVIGCGDLPSSYLDYVVGHLDKPFFYVEGNHVPQLPDGQAESGQSVHGGYDLHGKVVRHRGILLAGVAGSLDYNRGPYQYSQSGMWLNTARLLPRLLFYRGVYRQRLDLFITHAPPLGIHDQPDLPHRGINAFLWLDRVFKPRLHLHGHIHYYRPDTVIETQLGPTLILNTYRYKMTEIDLPGWRGSRGG